MNEISPPPVRWQPDRAGAVSTITLPPMGTALLRGLVGHCPSCGHGKVFRGYLKVVPQCAVCAAPLGLARADDAPPYFTILIVGHIVIPLMLMTERDWSPSVLLSAAIWLPVTLILTLALLRPVKGATVGLMLKLGMLKTGDDG